MKRKWSKNKYQKMAIALFAIVLLGGMVLGLLFPLRPTVSEEEKRTLTKFPKFSVSSFLDGSYFSEISLWYSDTYPMRDSLIMADQKVKSFYGVEQENKIVGGNQSGDAIPTIVEEDLEKESSEETATETKQAEESEEEKEKASTKNDKKEKVRKVNPPDAKQIDQEFQKQVTAGLYIKDTAAYAIYYYVQKTADLYISTVNNVAKELEGKTNVYSVLIPNSSAILLSEEELNGMGGSDESQAIDYYYSRLNDNVKTVSIFDTLKEHKEEYIYFRTDHHWTQDGAYYAYREFCKEKGIEPHGQDFFESKDYGDFLGSYYFELKSAGPKTAKKMKKDPDSIKAYIPKGTNRMKVWTRDGQEHDWALIQNAEEWKIGAKYDLFLGGDNPLTIIENPEIKDGSSCLVMKESYGNVFLPFLVDHYEKVYAVDFRYSDINVLDYVKEHEIDDLILLNNVSIVANNTIINTIHNLLS